MTRRDAVFNVLVGLMLVRGIVHFGAIPLIPLLYREHFELLVLMRAAKEMILAGGFFARYGDVSLVWLALATIPLGVFGVWHFYLVGKLYSRRIAEGRVPGWARRFLPTDQLSQLRSTLEDRGSGVIFLGRIAVFPKTLLGVAAGTMGMSPRQYLPADAAGAVVSNGAMIALGYALGYGYRQAGPWITAVGVVAIIAMVLLLGHYIRTTFKSPDSQPAT